MATKAENIFKATRHEALEIIKTTNQELTEHWVIAGWAYGNTPEGQQFMTQRTLNAVKKLVEKEVHRLDMGDKYGIDYDPMWREAIRVLIDMVEGTQRELDREKEERKARRTMSYEDFMAKYYPQYV
jgi:hypothetical protein